MRNKIITSFFCLLLAVSALIGLLLPDRYYSEREKRTLTQKPQFTIADFISGEFSGELEKYLTDQVPLRDGWVTMKTYMELAIGKRESGGVYICKDKYLMDKFTSYSKKQLAANAAALAVFFLIDLRERGLDECARPAEQRHDPHPEHGAEAAEADGRGHADDVAGADTGRRGHHERAERGNAALLLRLFRDDVDRLAKQAELDQTGADREIQARDDQKQRHDVRLVQKAADRIDHTVNFVNHDLSPLQFFIFPATKQPRDR